MKKFYYLMATIIFCLCMNYSAKAQRNTRQLLSYTAVFECNILGEEVNLKDPISAKGDALFDSIGTKSIGDKDYFIIKFLNYEDNPALQSQFNFKLDSTSIQKSNQITLTDRTELIKFFLISEPDYLGKSIKYTKESHLNMTVGTLTIPIKLRFAHNRIYDFSKDITLSGAGGIRYKADWLHENALIPYIGVGITSISLDSTNTFGDIKNSSDRSGVTIVTGLVFESKKGVQIGLTAGWDYLARKENIDWINNGNLWFGFGIGFSLFSESQGSISTENLTNIKTK